MFMRATRGYWEHQGLRRSHLSFNHVSPLISVIIVLTWCQPLGNYLLLFMGSVKFEFKCWVMFLSSASPNIIVLPMMFSTCCKNDKSCSSVRRKEQETLFEWIFLVNWSGYVVCTHSLCNMNMPFTQNNTHDVLISWNQKMLNKVYTAKIYNELFNDYLYAIFLDIVCWIKKHCAWSYEMWINLFIMGTSSHSKLNPYMCILGNLKLGKLIVWLKKKFYCDNNIKWLFLSYESSWR